MDSETWVTVGLATFGLAVVGGLVAFATKSNRQIDTSPNTLQPSTDREALVRRIVADFPSQFRLSGEEGFYRVSSDGNYYVPGADGNHGYVYVTVEHQNPDGSWYPDHYHASGPAPQVRSRIRGRV